MKYILLDWEILGKNSQIIGIILVFCWLRVSQKNNSNFLLKDKLKSYFSEFRLNDSLTGYFYQIPL